MKDKGPDARQAVARYPVIFYIKGRALVFGGGSVGMRKAVSLADHGVDVMVVDEKDLDCPKNIKAIRRHVEGDGFKELIDGETSIVVCALDDPALNERIASYCMERSIMVNVATSRTQGTFAFPAILDSGEDVIAITSLATCPLCSHAMKRYVAKEMPNLRTFSNLMHALSEEGLLERELLAKVLSNEEVLRLVREGMLDEALGLVRGIVI